jgi:hypothetical protein
MSENIIVRRGEVAMVTSALNVLDLPPELLSLDCKESRSPVSGCPNNRQCRNMFIGLSDQVMLFRQVLYDGVPTSSVAADNDALFNKRKENLLSLLKSMRNMNGEIDINFCVNGVIVCKYFFRLCTGFRRQYFDRILRGAIDGSSSSEVVMTSYNAYRLPTPQSFLRDSSTNLRLKVQAALDKIFKSKFVKSDAAKPGYKISIRSSWKSVYDVDFRKWCGGHFLCGYKKFCEIRSKYRPYYIKSPRMKKGTAYVDANFIKFILIMYCTLIGGYNHAVCLRCEQLKQEINNLKSLDPKKKEMETIMRLHEEHADLMVEICHGNRIKAINSEIDNPTTEAIHISILSDTLGSFSLKTLPHKAFHACEGITRADLLGIHTELSMVHNHGVYPFVSFPDLETCGGDMTLEAIFRSLYLSLKARPRVKRVLNLYVGLDNTVSSNKCWSVMRGFATLVALGIVEKVKPVFRIVGHTKNEVDQAGGCVSTAIMGHDMLTPSKWMDKAVRSLNGKKEPCFEMRQGEFCTDGCPHYSAGFEEKYSSTRAITGLARMHIGRFAMHPTDDKVEFHMKAHGTDEGWFPR